MFQKKLRAVSAFLACTLMLGTLAACGNSSAGSAAGSGSGSAAGSASTSKPAEPAYKELTVYTAITETEVPYYFNAFEKDTGIKVNYVRLSAGEMLARVKAESANPMASVMYGGSTDNYISAAKDGLLEAYQSPELANVPDQYKDKDSIWNPCYVGAMSFCCNKDWFEKNKIPYPLSWQDLLKPEFKGQITMGHPATAGTGYTILSTLVQLMGEEQAFQYYKDLNDNVRQYCKAGAAPATQVGLGEAAIGILFSHDALKPADEGYPVELTFPSEGTGYEIGAVALIKNGPEKEQENAKTFIDWALSVRGQECYIESKSHRMPVNTNAKVSDGLVPLDNLNIIDFDVVWSGENRSRLVEEFVAQIDNGENVKS